MRTLALRWLVPTFPTTESLGRLQITAGLLLAMLCLMLGVSDKMLQDPDTYWHIAVGEQIWFSHRLPWEDELSHTFTGSRWIAKEWLSQLIFFAAYAAASWPGITFVVAATSASAFALMAGWLMCRLRTTVAIGLSLIAWLMASAQINARPQIFFFPLLMIWVGGFIVARERNTLPSLWLIPLIALWANLHASFTIGYVVAGVFALEAICFSPASQRNRVALSWAVFGVAALLGAGATPYGYEPLLVTFKVMLGGGEATRYIDEWRPITAEWLSVIKIVALLGTLGVLITSPRQNAFRILLAVFCGFLMIQHSRFGGLFGIVVAMSLAGPLERAFPKIRADHLLLDKRAQLGFITLMFVLLISAGVTLSLRRPVPKPEITPSAALQAAISSGLTGPVYNDYGFGGYLIFRHIQTFIDGRSDQLFGTGFISEVLDAKREKDGISLLNILNRYHVTWAIVRPESIQQFEKLQGWRILYQDTVAAVFRKISD
jgi:hypothetical protein